MTYKTILKPSEEVLYKDKGSKFYGYAFPIHTTEEVKNNIIDKLKQKHSMRVIFVLHTNLGSKHHITALPMMESPQTVLACQFMVNYKRLTLLMSSWWWFVILEGQNLGVGGLISAYKTTAKLSLEASD